MAVATHLADKSALARMGEGAVARRLGPMIESGLVGTCGVIELEVRFSARSHTEYEQISRDRGIDFMNQVWNGQENLPTEQEIHQPAEWIARIERVAA